MNLIVPYEYCQPPRESPSQKQRLGSEVSAGGNGQRFGSEVSAGCNALDLKFRLCRIDGDFYSSQSAWTVAIATDK
jgi:hypothetical protein